MFCTPTNLAAKDSAVWIRIHRIPFFFGVATFIVAAIMGILITYCAEQQERFCKQNISRTPSA
jgi:uncharacterized protein YqhQ